jgi:hypothetical protein
MLNCRNCKYHVDCTDDDTKLYCNVYKKKYDVLKLGCIYFIDKNKKKRERSAIL